MSNVNPVHLTPTGPPETVLPDSSPEFRRSLDAALAAGEDRRDRIASVVAAHPRVVEGWVELAEATSDSIGRYAFHRIGYHRGLDALRANGWRGSGYVRWQHRSNRAFLRSLRGLQRSAAEIGETDEEERCAIFLRQLEPGDVPELR